MSKAKLIHHIERVGFTRDTLLFVQGGRCWLCNGRMKNQNLITRDHVVPKSRGATLPKNMLLAHAQCNHKRGDTPPTKEQLAYLRMVHHAAIAYVLAD